ncbi:MAG: hypothetical protein AAFR96_00005, partial [Planctomycetota bacterium]
GEPPVETVELFRRDIDPQGFIQGTLVDVIHRFEVASANPAVIIFAAADTSLSLDRVSVDTRSSEADSCAADANGDGLVTPADFTAWILNFNTGC